MPSQPNLSLINGLACLQELVANDGPVGSRELARRLGLEATRVNRLLGTLAQLGLAEQDGERKYRPGPGVHVLAAQSLHGSRLLRAALPEIRDLLGLGFSVAIGVLWRDQVCYLYHGRDASRIEDGISAHELYPATRSSIGVVLLAQRPDGDPQIRAAGHAFLRPGSPDASLAVPIGSPAYAGVALSGALPESRIPALIERLQATARRIAGTTSTGSA